MKRKDCDNISLNSLRTGAAQRAAQAGSLVAVVLVLGGVGLRAAQAGSLRMWGSAVVVGDEIHLGDVCELTGFDEAGQAALTELVLTAGPPAGGSRVVHMDMVRAGLAQAGTNLATTSLFGAMQCTVVRPAALAMPSKSIVAAPGAVQSAAKSRDQATTGNPPSSTQYTLRKAVIEYFHGELARYGGRADVVFDRTSEQVLDLSGPTYTFHVRRRSGPALGLIPLEVEVLADGDVVQTVPLVAQVSMIRQAAVARRAINQGATIDALDVEVASMSFSRIEHLGMDDAARVIGQRAKRFVPAGSMIEPAMLEAVPLVVRGQLVTLTSTAGGIRVVTAAKSTQDGLLGETVKVQAVDAKRVDFDAVVVGPGKVELCATSVLSSVTSSERNRP